MDVSVTKAARVLKEALESDPRKWEIGQVSAWNLCSTYVSTDTRYGMVFLFTVLVSLPRCSLEYGVAARTYVTRCVLRRLGVRWSHLPVAACRLCRAASGFP